MLIFLAKPKHAKVEKMKKPENLSASLEDYLEAIYQISAVKSAARAKDIACRLNVNNSSVTGALRSLSAKGYINYTPYELITLTGKGETAAGEIVRRHEALQFFLENLLCISKKEAEETACKMEHVVSAKIMDRLIAFMGFIEKIPGYDDNWIKHIELIYRDGNFEENCRKCLSEMRTDSLTS